MAVHSGITVKFRQSLTVIPNHIAQVAIPSRNSLTVNSKVLNGSYQLTGLDHSILLSSAIAQGYCAGFQLEIVHIWQELGHSPRILYFDSFVTINRKYYKCRPQWENIVLL